MKPMLTPEIAVEPFINGTITGPAFNGTILGGIGSPRIYNQGTSQLPTVIIYGYTDDGVPFFVREDGIGSPSSAFTRIVSSLSMLFKA
jgi:hypothetical protein